MKISENGLKLIKKWEGCRLKAYRDVAGIWTIGYGTTTADIYITGLRIREGLEISQKQADDFLIKSINLKYIPKVEKYQNKYKFNQNQLDALISFCYNIGSIDELTKNGTRTKKQISEHFTGYSYANGRFVKGLYNRRIEEKKLFDKKGKSESEKYKNGDIVEINTPMYFTGAFEDGKYLYDTEVEQTWINEDVKTLIVNDMLKARVVILFIEGETAGIEVFNNQFKINKKYITKKLQ